MTEIIICAAVVITATAVYLAGRAGAYFKEKTDYYDEKAFALRVETLEDVVQACTFAGILRYKEEGKITGKTIDETISFTVSNVASFGITANEDVVKTMCLSAIYVEVS